MPPPSLPRRIIQRLFARLRRDLLVSLSGSPDGEAPWVPQMSEGSDAGYFGEGSAVWAVHGANPTLVGGIRALLMQALHPGAMAGVAEHSRYHSDPLGRLSGTVRWVVVTTFGSTDVVDREMSRVTTMHQKVRGDYSTNTGERTPYTAQDADLLAWVHLVFTESFLSAHQKMGGSIPGANGESGPDRYVREWAKAGELMGYPDPPRSEKELRDTIAAYKPQLRRDERVRDALKFILNPPLPASMKPGYRLLAAGAVASLDNDYREMLGLKKPWWLALPIAAATVRFIGFVLGPESPSMRRARERISALRPAY
ncbi:MAG: oxygenase MpaB family protein [Pontimonas sp.]